MAKNLIPDVCKFLGVEVGERFKIHIKNADVINPTTYAILNSGTLCYYSGDDVSTTSTTLTIQHLLNGYAEIVKLPFKPKGGEIYYTFELENNKLHADERRWVNGYIDCLAALKAGWVFRTREEAEEALPKVAEELGGVEYGI